MFWQLAPYPKSISHRHVLAMSWQGLRRRELRMRFQKTDQAAHKQLITGHTCLAYTIYGEDTVTRHRAGIQTQEMQRQPYAPPPAHSPPLHHPVPQHVSTVPMMRSPPPPAPSQGGTPYGGYVNPAASGGNQFAPAFGGFMNDQTAQMGFQLGKSAAMAGQEYVEQNVCIR